MLLGRVKDVMKKVAQTAGVDLRSGHHIFSCRFLRHVRRLELNTIVVVGANRGQFAQEMFGNDFKGTIVSFEPQPDIVAVLVAKSRQHGDGWIIAPPLALAEESGGAIFTRMKADAMSTLLTGAERLSEAVPSAGVAGQFTVKLARLDEVLPGMLHGETGDFALKIDTQGAELRILDGARGLLPRARLIQLEASIGQLYEGQPAYYEIDARLRREGYVLVDLEPGYRHPESGALLEFDAVFERIKVP